ncbi:MAG: non-heme iron oxygenase ferredoxin subunit [Rhodobacterales bacterium]|nr:non-heme iron oxygenase ferredoxin subunit [Rhodobacterales bacterium]
MDDGWQDLIALTDLHRGWVTRATLGNRVLAVHDTPGGVYVTAALCTHGGADLCDGYFDGHLIECPLHQGAFDVRTGAPIGAPATRPLKTFAARVLNDRVQIRLT